MSAEVFSLVHTISTRHGWDARAIFSVIACETGETFAPDAGASRWSPTTTASGLLQWTEGTLRRLNVPASGKPPREELRKYSGHWRTWNLLSWPVGDQVELVERYYVAHLSKVPTRPVGYYLACWGAAPELPLGTVLAVKGESRYELNKGLDRDGDGKITVKDLARIVGNRMKTVSEPKVEATAAGLTLPGVALTIGFKVIQRRMLLGL